MGIWETWWTCSSPAVTSPREARRRPSGSRVWSWSTAKDGLERCICHAAGRATSCASLNALPTLECGRFFPPTIRSARLSLMAQNLRARCACALDGHSTIVSLCLSDTARTSLQITFAGDSHLSSGHSWKALCPGCGTTSTCRRPKVRTWTAWHSPTGHSKYSWNAFSTA